MTEKQSSKAPLKLHDYCLLPSLQICTIHEWISNIESKWTFLIRNKKFSSRSKYLRKKVSTNNTQIVQRVRRIPIKPQFEIQDLQDINQNLFTAVPMMPEALRELFSPQADEFAESPNTKNIADTSSFYTPNLEKQSCSTHTTQSSPTSGQI